MFHTLYHRYKESLNPAGSDSLYPFPWPATYAEGADESLDQGDPTAFALHVSGLVEHPTVFSWEQWITLPTQTMNRRIVSAQGWTHRGNWQGVLLKDVMTQVKPFDQAKYLMQVNRCGQTECLAVEEALAGEALLCYQANGHYLSSLYGGPVWFMVFDRYHYKGLGQLTHLEFSDEDVDGFWAGKGYPPTGTIAPGSYYAFDLGDYHPINAPGEVTTY